jgi:hypothetical protein
MVGFSWDGSFVAGSSDEGNGIEIVSLCFLGFLREPKNPYTYFSCEVGLGVQSKASH